MADVPEGETVAIEFILRSLAQFLFYHCLHPYNPTAVGNERKEKKHRIQG